MRLLAVMLPGPKEATLSSVQGPDCRVLFTRYERIGDMIMATSLIRNIALSLPSGRVDVLATSRNAPVLEGNPYVGKVLMLERGSIKSYREVMKQIRRERYTVMVDGRINNPPVFTSTPLLMCAGRVQFRVGAEGDNTAVTFNIDVSQMRRERMALMGVRSALVFAVFGLGGTALFPGFGLADALALASGGIAAGGIFAIERRRFLESRERVALAPERFLDLLVQRRRRLGPTAGD